MQIFRLFVSLALLAASIFAQAQVAEDRLAFIVGNANYPGKAALVNPVNDANAIAGFLGDQGFQVVQLNNLTTRQIPELRQQLEKRVGRNTVLFIYYAGHGVQFEGRNYLLPVDTRMDNIEALTEDSVYLGDVLSAIEKKRPKLAVVMLDACRDNPFKDDKAFKLPVGLARVDPPSSTVVFYATRPGGVAADGADGNGLFTKELLTASKEINAPIEVVFRRASSAVYKASKGEQEPWVEGVIREEFVMASSQPRPMLQTDSSDNRPPALPISVEVVAALEPSTVTAPPLAPITVIAQGQLISWDVALRSLKEALKDASPDTNTRFYCEKDKCSPYKEWTRQLKEQEAINQLKSAFRSVNSNSMFKICEFDLDQKACVGDDVKTTIVPINLINSSFIEGVKLSEVKTTNSGGLAFEGNIVQGAKFFGMSKKYANCANQAGKLEFLNDRVELSLSRSLCLGVIPLPASSKLDFNVLLVDPSNKQFIVKWSWGMIGTMAVGGGSGIAKVTLQ